MIIQDWISAQLKDIFFHLCNYGVLFLETSYRVCVNSVYCHLEHQYSRELLYHLYIILKLAIYCTLNRINNYAANMTGLNVKSDKFHCLKFDILAVMDHHTVGSGIQNLRIISGQSFTAYRGGGEPDCLYVTHSVSL